MLMPEAFGVSWRMELDRSSSGLIVAMVAGRGWNWILRMGLTGEASGG